MYSEKIQKILKRKKIKVGDKIRVMKDKKTYEGILMPRIELGDKNCIVLKLENGYKRCYVSKQISTKDKELLSFIRQETPCNILLYIIFHFVSSQTELCRELNKKPSTISYHLNKLLEKEIITKVDVIDGHIHLTTGGSVFKNPSGREMFFMLI